MPAGPLSVDEAIAAVLAEVAPLPAVRVPLAEALGGVLAETITAPFPLPQWTNAAMDGYAVRAEDVRGATRGQPVTLPVVARVAAGDDRPRPLMAGEAMRIFTGGRVPPGADSVVRQEDSDRGATRVTIFADRDAGRHVRYVGSDLAAGGEALPRGCLIGPGELGLLAALAITEPMVHRRPRVAIISTGDELASLNDPVPIRTGERLADSNTPALVALTTRAGAEAIALGPVRDDPAALAATISGATDADMVITVGGVSVGDHDHVPAVIASLGARLLFRRVRLRPGGPTTAAVLPDGRFWLALPGNPVSAMVTFTLFARPAIRRMAGEDAPLRAEFSVTLTTPVERNPTLETCFRAAQLGLSADGIPQLAPTGPGGSALLTTMRGAEWLVRVAAGGGEVPAGTILPAVGFP